jgi:uncharacterized membrane protein (UPF0127 family)
MKISFRGKTFSVKARKLGALGKFSGLMFKGVNSENLLFDFEKEGRYGIHSLFVFIDFLALWLDSDDKIVDYKVVNPFTFHVCPEKEFAKLIEIPLNEENRKIFSYFLSN